MTTIDPLQEQYAAYELSVQLAALYGAALGETQIGEDHAAPCISANMTADVGILFHIAEPHINQMNRTDQLFVLPKNDLGRLVERLRKLQARLGIWTDNGRWLRVLIAAESCWLAQLHHIEQSHLLPEETIELLRTSSRERVQLLHDIQDRVRQCRATRLANFAIPASLL